MTEVPQRHFFLETPQQNIAALLRPETGVIGEELQHALDSSCTPHCVEAVLELHGLHLPSFERIEEYISFLQNHGAHPESGTRNESIYHVDDGWYAVGIADLLRKNRFEVISQNLTIEPKLANLNAAQNSGRVRSEREMMDLQRLAGYGGQDRDRWLAAIEDTLLHTDSGHAFVSIQIPSSKVPGKVSRHTILVMATDESYVYYFDPDALAIDRYGQNASFQMITRQDSDSLVYCQSRDRFMERMTGEVMHIFLPDDRTAMQ